MEREFHVLFFYIRKEKSMNDFMIIQKQSMIVVGIECRTSNAPNAGPNDIPKHWARFQQENIIDQIPNKVSNEVIALYCDYDGDYTQPYSFVLGCCTNILDDIPAGMVAKLVPAGSYAVFSSTGEYPKSLINTWGKIWQTNLKRTYTGDYEIYKKEFNPANSKGLDVLIAVEKN